MSIATEITRLTNLRNSIRSHAATDLSMKDVTTSSTLDGFNTAFANVAKNTVASQTIKCGSSVTISANTYVPTDVTITAETLSNQTSGTASASQILNGYTAWVNGSKITGTMTNNNGGGTTTLTGTTTSKTIAAGYWSSSNTVNVNTMSGKTVTLSSDGETISCKDKMMTSNIIIPSVNFYYTSSSAPSLTSGYTNGDLWLVV